VNDAPRKRVEISNANENKELTLPIIVENAVYAANFAPFLHPWRAVTPLQALGFNSENSDSCYRHILRRTSPIYC
jgi:hypothetical protein